MEIRINSGCCCKDEAGNAIDLSNCVAIRVSRRKISGLI